MGLTKIASYGLVASTNLMDHLYQPAFLNMLIFTWTSEDIPSYHEYVNSLSTNITSYAFFVWDYIITDKPSALVKYKINFSEGWTSCYKRRKK